MFHREVYDVEQKYQPQHAEVYKKRTDIVRGLYQPTAEEATLAGVEMKSEDATDGQDAPIGIPDFWVTALKHVGELKSSIQEADEQILKHLIDVRASTKPAPELSFQLDFEFAANEFFENSVLSKTYLMKCCVDPEDPFSFEGPEIYKSVGCEICWKDGKDLTKSGAKKSPMPFFECETFFNFFNPPQLQGGVSEENDQVEVSCDLVNFLTLQCLNFPPRRPSWKPILRSVTTSRSASSPAPSCSTPARPTTISRTTNRSSTRKTRATRRTPKPAITEREPKI